MLISGFEKFTTFTFWLIFLLLFILISYIRLKKSWCNFILIFVVNNIKTNIATYILFLCDQRVEKVRFANTGALTIKYSKKEEL